MPISSSAGTSQGCAEECIIPSADQDGRDRDGGAKRNGVGACADRSHARQAQMRSILSLVNRAHKSNIFSRMGWCMECADQD